MAKSEVRESTADIEEQIKAAIIEQARDEIDEQLLEQGDAMVEYAQSISPERTGEYKRSFEIHHIEGELPGLQLVNTDEIANLIEYGSIHNQEHAVIARTAEQFGGEHHRGE